MDWVMALSCPGDAFAASREGTHWVHTQAHSCKSGISSMLCGEREVVCMRIPYFSPHAEHFDCII